MLHLEIITDIILSGYEPGDVLHAIKRYNEPAPEDILNMRTEKKYDAILSCLLRCYSGAFLSLPKELLRKVVYLFELMDGDDKEKFEKEYEKVLNSAKDLPEKILTVRLWKTLYLIAFSNGLFRLGYVFRQKALIKSSKTDLLFMQFESAKANVELGNYHVAEKKLNRYKKAAGLLGNREVNRRIKAFENELCFLQGTYKGEQKGEYAEYLNSHDLTVCGPSPSNEQKKKKSGEAVIRIAYRGLNELPENERECSADITYYSQSIENEIDATGLVSDNEVKFVVIKGEKGPSSFEDQHILYTDNYYYNFFSGSPNMIPVIVMDVLVRCGIRKIRIEQASLYLGQMYGEGYLNIALNGDSVWWDAFAKHDSVSQLMFLKRFYEAGLVVPDDRLKDILAMDARDYVTELEKQYVLSVIPCDMRYESNKLIYNRKRALK